MRNAGAFPLLTLLAAVVCLWPVAASAVVPVPELRGRVNDYAQLLTADQAAQLEQQLAEFERATSNQVVILTVPSLEGEARESFALRVAEAWRIGQKGRDNGAVLVVAAKEHQVRLEVGYGLEGSLPDATAARIIREVIAPRFKAGDYYGGLRNAVQAIIAATRGEFSATSKDDSPSGGSRASKRGLNRQDIGMVIGIVVFLILLSTRTGRWILFYMMLSGGFGGGRGRSGGFGGGFRGGGGGFGGGGAGGSW